MVTALIVSAVLCVSVVRVAAQSEYVIGPQDVLAITVWNQLNLSGKFVVEADGTFTFPMLGKITAGGATVRELETEFRRRLGDGYFNNPQLTITVDEYRSQRIFIVGEVRQPGSFPITGALTLVEALALAGSTNQGAAAEIVLVRPPEGSDQSGPVLPGQADDAEVIRIDLQRLQNGEISQNVALRDGDTIFVPRAETIFVFGQVRNPGAYPIAADTTAMQALSLAGGLTDRGAGNRLKVIRVVDGKKKEIGIELDDVVKPGDTLVVPERFF